MKGYYKEDFLTENIHKNNQDRGKRWGLTWFGNEEELKKTDLIKFCADLRKFPHIIEFVAQIEICSTTGYLHIHAAIALDSNTRKPVPQLKKRFPGIHIQHAIEYKLWQSFCCKEETRVPGTNPTCYGEIDLEQIPYYVERGGKVFSVKQKEEEKIRSKLDRKDLEDKIKEERKNISDSFSKFIHKDDIEHGDVLTSELSYLGKLDQEICMLNIDYMNLARRIENCSLWKLYEKDLNFSKKLVKQELVKLGDLQKLKMQSLKEAREKSDKINNLVKNMGCFLTVADIKSLGDEILSIICNKNSTGKLFSSKEKEFNRIILERNYRLQDKYTDPQTPVLCRCDQNHPCMILPDKIDQKEGFCDQCYKYSLGQTKLRKALELLSFEFKEEYPINKYRYDFRVGEYLFEFDGIQHFKINGYSSTQDALELTQKRDKKKMDLCLELGYKMIRFDYSWSSKEPIDFSKSIKEAIDYFKESSEKVWVSNINFYKWLL